MWLLDHAPLLLLVPVAGGLVYLAWRLGGIKGVVAAAAFIAAALFYREGRQTGQADSQAKGRVDAQQTVQRAQEARIDAERRDADPERLREDDGFRRD